MGRCLHQGGLVSDVPAIRLDARAVFALKAEALAQLDRLYDADRKIAESLEKIHAYQPYRIDNHYGCTGPNAPRQEIDKLCWRYMVRLYELEKWMLCTDYKKLLDEIEHYNTPEFTLENAEGWVAGLQGLIHDNVQTLIKQVFNEITQGYYYTGSRNNGERKKRNNSGIDQSFILYTSDYSSIFGYWSSTPTVTDDLEKVCYILDGKALPKETLKRKASSDRTMAASNPYMDVTFCKNGNTHYKIQDDIREKLNRWGPSGAVLGENIKIKIFEKGNGW